MHLLTSPRGGTPPPPVFSSILRRIFMFWRSDVFECADLGTSWGIVGASSVPRGQQGALRGLPRSLGVCFRRPWALLGAALGGPGNPVCPNASAVWRLPTKKASLQKKEKHGVRLFVFCGKRKTALAFGYKGENMSVFGGLGRYLGRPWEALEFV